MLEAASGDDALRLAREHLPDAVLVDLAMPGLNGLDAAQLLKQDPDTVAIPLIAMTASWLARGPKPPVLLAELARVLSSRPVGS